jgi:hypothetical protein
MASLDGELDRLLDSKVLTTKRCTDKSLNLLIFRLRNHIEKEIWEGLVDMFDRVMSATGTSSRKNRNSFATIVQHASCGPRNYVRYAKIALLRVVDETVGDKQLTEVEPVKPRLTKEVMLLLDEFENQKIRDFMKERESCFELRGKKRDIALQSLVARIERELESIHKIVVSWKFQSILANTMDHTHKELLASLHLKSKKNFVEMLLSSHRKEIEKTALEEQLCQINEGVICITGEEL